MSGDQQGAGSSGTENPLLRSKRALELSRKASEDLEKAVGEREALENGKPPGTGAAEHRSAVNEARADEGKAREELARASEELWEATAGPRVEGFKLRYEARKLQATLSAGLLLGVAAVTEVLLSASPDYTFLLWATYAVLLVSVSGCLSDMERISIYTENVLTGGQTEAHEGWRERVSRIEMWVNQRSLTLGLALFTLFVTLNLA